MEANHLLFFGEGKQKKLEFFLHKKDCNEEKGCGEQQWQVQANRFSAPEPPHKMVHEHTPT